MRTAALAVTGGGPAQTGKVLRKIMTNRKMAIQNNLFPGWKSGNAFHPS
jgi:hypothetical protein